MNGPDEPEPPERLPSLLDRVRKMLGKEGLGLYLELGEVEGGAVGADQAVKVTHEFFLKGTGPSQSP